MTGQHHFWISGLDTSQIFIFDPYSGRAGPGPGAVPADIRRPADDSTPVVDTFMGGTNARVRRERPAQSRTDRGGAEHPILRHGRRLMSYAMLGVIGALAFGAAVGAILPVPAHEPHEQQEATMGRPELATPSSAELDYAPPAPGS